MAGLRPVYPFIEELLKIHSGGAFDGCHEVSESGTFIAVLLIERSVGVKERLFSDEAVRRLFQASHGRPRSINQLATHVLIRAVIEGRDALDGDFVARQIAAHPLYKSSHQEDR